MNADEIYDNVAPSVVYVSANAVAGPSAFDAQAGGDTGGQLALSTGSGFVLDDDGRILTSAHVISGVTSVQVMFSDGTHRARARARQGRGERHRGSRRSSRTDSICIRSSSATRTPCGPVIR